MTVYMTETWLDGKTKEYSEIEGHNLYRRDRSGKKRGGAAIY